MVKKRKMKDPKCNHDGCEQRVPLAQQLIGKCTRCTKIYCIEHRLPEIHKCLISKIEVSAEEKDKLINNMKCVATKV